MSRKPAMRFHGMWGCASRNSDWKALRRLPHDFEAAQDGVLRADIAKELVLADATVLQDERERVADVEEDHLVAVLQTGTASRRTASRM